MGSVLKKIRNVLNTKSGFFVLVLFCFWLKTYLTYQTKFNLGVSGSVQQILLMLNPLPIGILLFGIALYFRGRKSYWIMMIVSLLESMWLFANILYYREFSDFLSLGIIKSSGSVSNNLGLSIVEIIHPTDFLVFLDVIILGLLLVFKVIKVDRRRIRIRSAVLVSTLAVVLFGVNLSASEKNRPQLLTRTFDNNYIVKYLGINFYAGYNAYQTYKESSTRANASSSDLNEVLNYLKTNRAAANVSYYGKAKGKNVFIFHLESFQQFLINYKVNGQEVTPNVNKFYSDSNTLSFDNFFNQVGQGKTSDAETMLENSLFGLPSGSVMTSYGTSNTFQALPAMLDQKGYSTAAFHGDVGSFWNRNNTYKSWGYQYFFNDDYYKQKTNYSVGYGLKDKIFLKQATQYLEQLPQPFYAKLITVTNHYPYELDKENQSIQKTTTGDSTVDGYVQTAHYLDQAFGEFISYLKKSGLYDNSMIVVYGDHYGISNNHKKAIAQLLGKSSISSYDLAMFQKVPFMIHSNGLKGGVNHTYGGEIDVMPTLMDLLGLKNTDTIQLGNDLLSENRNQTVAFRNGDFVSPTYSKIGSKVYDSNGQVASNLTTEQKKSVDGMQARTNKVLSLSDKIVTGDLLRFYTPSGFKKVDKRQYSYKYSDGIKLLKKQQQTSKSSLIQQKGGHSTTDLFTTDAPELK
ncbi:LTA synthase family protein [Liquorilactobacillus satsumensis]|uniref:Sulfatase n=1 Tax=Liquorilactobacillus satsumensis DSM 16230 = JCM 12392 TaxID=1423801 RepID=A0A0R1V3D3_9LACO|nr:LTA synthase family protein [Liquorilactobacillus satsumensis]KRL97752.1 sulfatase [Liquorilactobacillus satsumensis DSM 16230 = JCM 12392]MCC7666489.1 LTA synthase family protein [Liquorilactobacillus satsumensis]MCP9312900.1 LTA synthase family protein [Liquorilactobacillus satsumensis]MCP9329751.1 LTA synthase family protein [Liquorilactobacillus satsumensis]MCP9357545.1 LTA synthase family protein [Liquorilactobacillus satsumensis]